MKTKTVKNLSPQNSDGNIGFDIMRDVLNRILRNKGLGKNGQFEKQNELPLDSHLEVNLSLIEDR